MTKPLYAVLPFLLPSSAGSRTCGFVRLSLERETAERLLQEIEESAERQRRGKVPPLRVTEKRETPAFFLPTVDHPQSTSAMAPLQGAPEIRSRFGTLLVTEEFVEPFDIRFPYPLERLITPSAIQWEGWKDRSAWKTPHLTIAHLATALLLQSPARQHRALWRRIVRLSPWTALSWLDGIRGPMGTGITELPRPKLQPRDLLPLLESEEASLRLEAVTRLGALTQAAPPSAPSAPEPSASEPLVRAFSVRRAKRSLEAKPRRQAGRL